MDELTFSEAHLRMKDVETRLTEYHVEPYAVVRVGAQYMCLESYPPIYSASKVSVTVSVPTETHKNVPTVVPLNWSTDWVGPTFLKLRCGLLHQVSTEDRERIAYWKWKQPAQWQEERKAWREGKVAHISATEEDKMNKQLFKYRAMKEQFVVLLKAFDSVNASKDSKRSLAQRKKRRYESDGDAPERPTKRQRTDAEVLAEREKGVGLALPGHDDDDI